MDLLRLTQLNQPASLFLFQTVQEAKIINHYDTEIKKCISIKRRNLWMSLFWKVNWFSLSSRTHQRWIISPSVHRYRTFFRSHFTFNYSTLFLGWFLRPPTKFRKITRRDMFGCFWRQETRSEWRDLHLQRKRFLSLELLSSWNPLGLFYRTWPPSASHDHLSDGGLTPRWEGGEGGGCYRSQIKTRW